MTLFLNFERSNANVGKTRTYPYPYMKALEYSVLRWGFFKGGKKKTHWKYYLNKFCFCFLGKRKGLLKCKITTKTELSCLNFLKSSSCSLKKTVRKKFYFLKIRLKNLTNKNGLRVPAMTKQILLLFSQSHFIWLWLR